MQYRSAVKVGVIFENAKNKKRAKEFVQFFMQDEEPDPVRRGLARPLVPGHESGAARDFWTSDPHRRIVHNQFSAGTLPFDFTKNYKFTILNNEKRVGQKPSTASRRPPSPPAIVVAMRLMALAHTFSLVRIVNL